MSLFSTLPNNVFIEASQRFSKSITLDKGRSEIYSWLKQLHIHVNQLLLINR